MTTKSKLSNIRSEAKRVGLTFKVDTRTTINGATAYIFIDRETKQVVSKNWTVYSADYFLHDNALDYDATTYTLNF